MITVDFSETIAASDLKGTWSRHLIEYILKAKSDFTLFIYIPFQDIFE